MATGTCAADCSNGKPSRRPKMSVDQADMPTAPQCFALNFPEPRNGNDPVAR